MSNRYKIDKDMLGVLQRHKQVCTEQFCTTCNEYVAMINPPIGMQKALDIDRILKQGYKVANLSNGSIGVYLGNDEDTQELEYKTQKASNAQQENTPMTDKLTVYKAELLKLQHALDSHNQQLLTDIEYYKLTRHAYGCSISTIQATEQVIEIYKARIELLKCKIDSIDDHNRNLAVALQQLSDARVSLLQAYTTGVGVLVAENDLIAVREQYNAIHGV